MNRNLSDIVKKIREKTYSIIFFFFTKITERKKRNRYYRKKPTGKKCIISRNCVAGVIYHDLGLEFQT